MKTINKGSSMSEQMKISDLIGFMKLCGLEMTFEKRGHKVKGNIYVAGGSERSKNHVDIHLERCFSNVGRSIKNKRWQKVPNRIITIPSEAVIEVDVETEEIFSTYDDNGSCYIEISPKKASG